MQPIASIITSAFLGAFLAISIGVALAYAAAKRTAAAVLATANTALLMRVDDLERQNALISRQTIPISAAFQATLIQDLTHFHTPEMDALLVKLGPPFVLTQREVDRLIMLLEERERDLGGDVGQGERDAARMLPMVIRRVAADQLRTGLHAEPLVRVFVNRAEVAGMQ